MPVWLIGEEGDEAPEELRAEGLRSVPPRQERGATKTSDGKKVDEARGGRSLPPPEAHVRKQQQQ